MLIADAATVKLTEFVHGRLATNNKNVKGIVDNTLSDWLDEYLSAKRLMNDNAVHKKEVRPISR